MQARPVMPQQAAGVSPIDRRWYNREIAKQSTGALMSGGDWKEMFGAAVDGDIELLRYHLSSGVDPNYQHPEFMSTPLVAALLAGQGEAAALLVEHGADRGLLSETDGMTPLQAARHSGRVELVRLIDPLAELKPPRPQGFWQRWFGASAAAS